MSAAFAPGTAGESAGGPGGGSGSERGTRRRLPGAPPVAAGTVPGPRGRRALLPLRAQAGTGHSDRYRRYRGPPGIPCRPALPREQPERRPARRAPGWAGERGRRGRGQSAGSAEGRHVLPPPAPLRGDTGVIPELRAGSGPVSLPGGCPAAVRAQRREGNFGRKAERLPGSRTGDLYLIKCPFFFFFYFP